MPDEPSGHVFRVERKRGPQWYAKYRLPDGRQVQRRIGAAWSGRGRPAAGYYTKRAAEEWLRDVIDQARRGTLPGQVRTGVTFAAAAAEWLRYVEHDRERKASTVAGYRALVRSQLLPVFGELPIESVTTPMIERWLAGVERSPQTRMKSLVLMNGIFKRARKRYGLRFNPVADVERPTVPNSGEYRGLLARGGPGADARSGFRAGRGDLSDRGIHRVAPRRAARAALARCRLRRPRGPRAGELRRGPAHDTEVRQGPLSPDGPRRRDRARR